MKVFSIEKFLNDPSILAEVKLYCLASGWPQACEGKSADKTECVFNDTWMVEEDAPENIIFDRSKVLTSDTADKARKGMRGWFSDDIGKLGDRVKEYQSVALEDIGAQLPFSFVDDIGLRYKFFYPDYTQDYGNCQDYWIEEHDWSIGDKVTVKENWECSPFYNVIQGLVKVGDTYEILRFDDVDGIISNSPEFEGDVSLPYFAIEKTEKAYIPFSDADMVELTGRKVECNGKFFDVTDCRVMAKIGDDWFDAEEMFDMFTIGGKPCGIEV